MEPIHAFTLTHYALALKTVVAYEKIAIHFLCACLFVSINDARKSCVF